MTTRPRRVAADPEAERQLRAQRAIAHLRAADARLAQIIDRVGPHRPEVVRDAFTALVHSILQQQVSMAAAATIFRRLRAACPRKRVTAAAVLALDETALRGLGISRQKAGYLRGLAEAFAARRLSGARLRRLGDDDVLAATTALKGIGRWTAEMLLIFCLERPDIWPIDDLGLRKAVQRHLGLDGTPDRAMMEQAGEPFRPYRTYASWYLWRSLEGPLMPGVRLA